MNVKAAAARSRPGVRPSSGRAGLHAGEGPEEPLSLRRSKSRRSVAPVVGDEAKSAFLAIFEVAEDPEDLPRVLVARSTRGLQGSLKGRRPLLDQRAQARQLGECPSGVGTG
jgi:hypothetical protein